MAGRSIDDLVIELDELGEDEVRKRFVRGAYGKTGPKYTTVEDWLRKQDQDRKDASSSESLEIARSAKDAAWAAATAARDAAAVAREAADAASDANTIAKIALAIAIIAAVISVFSD